MSILLGRRGGEGGEVRSRDCDPRTTVTDASSVHCDLVYHGVVLVAAAARRRRSLSSFDTQQYAEGNDCVTMMSLASDHAPYGATPITPNHRTRSKDRGLD